MSKSLEFCMAIASDPQRSGYAGRDWSKSIEMDSVGFFDRFLNGERNLTMTGTDECDDIHVDISLLFDKDANFDYFTSCSYTHDGTLLFITEMMSKLVEKVCCAITYNKTLRAPKSGDTVEYTVGNFVILNEYGEQFAPEDKPWMRERTTVLLPLKMEIKKD